MREGFFCTSEKTISSTVAGWKIYTRAHTRLSSTHRVWFYIPSTSHMWGSESAQSPDVRESYASDERIPKTPVKLQGWERRIHRRSIRHNSRRGPVRWVRKSQEMQIKVANDFNMETNSYLKKKKVSSKSLLPLWHAGGNLHTEGELETSSISMSLHKESWRKQLFITF